MWGVHSFVFAVVFSPSSTLFSLWGSRVGWRGGWTTSPSPKGPLRRVGMGVPAVVSAQEQKVCLNCQRLWWENLEIEKPFYSFFSMSYVRVIRNPTTYVCTVWISQKLHRISKYITDAANAARLIWIIFQLISLPQMHPTLTYLKLTAINLDHFPAITLLNYKRYINSKYW
jgi:hypothetical protein